MTDTGIVSYQDSKGNEFPLPLTTNASTGASSMPDCSGDINTECGTCSCDRSWNNRAPNSKNTCMCPSCTDYSNTMPTPAGCSPYPPPTPGPPTPTPPTPSPDPPPCGCPGKCAGTCMNANITCDCAGSSGGGGGGGGGDFWSSPGGISIEVIGGVVAIASLVVSVYALMRRYKSNTQSPPITSTNTVSPLRSGLQRAMSWGRGNSTPSSGWFSRFRKNPLSAARRNTYLGQMRHDEVGSM